MKFGLDKCATAEFKRGKLTKPTSIILDEETAIKELQQGDSYKYLGINEAEEIQHAKMKEKIRKEYYRRARLILKSELNAVNRIAAINSLAIPVITYSMNIINWQINDIKKLDTTTRKFLTMYRMHHPKADVDRLYLPRNERRERTDTNRADLQDNNCWSRNILERKQGHNDETGLRAREEKEVVFCYEGSC